MAMLNTCLNITSVVDYLLVAVRITQSKDALENDGAMTRQNDSNVIIHYIMNPVVMTGTCGV